MSTRREADTTGCEDEGRGDVGRFLDTRRSLAGRLLSIWAHDLKTPLATLQMGIDYLIRNTVGSRGPQEADGTGRVVMEEMGAAIERLSRALGYLIDVATPGAVREAPQTTDLPRALERCLLLFEPALRRRGIRVEKAAGADLPPLEASPSAVELAILELLEFLLRPGKPPRPGGILRLSTGTRSGTGFARVYVEIQLVEQHRGEVAGMRPVPSDAGEGDPGAPGYCPGPPPSAAEGALELVRRILEWNRGTLELVNPMGGGAWRGVTMTLPALSGHVDEEAKDPDH